MDSATGNPYRIYVITWAILLVITVLMLGAESMGLPKGFMIVFLLVFMAVKAYMIGWNFMHLKYERPNLGIMVAAGIIVTSLILYFFIRPEASHVLQHSIR
jgi:caa(3)-type oxidase subunit IV